MNEHNPERVFPDAAADAETSNLVRIDADRPESQARDINAKIDTLDASLAKLNAELDGIRDSVDEGLDKLSDNDLDLTAKVSDTYKRLGELDNTYKSLASISASIHEEIGRLTNDISRVASDSTAELEKLEATSQVHNAYLTHQNETLAQRIDGLVSEAHETSARLQVSIKEVQHKLLSSEQKLVLDIGSLAQRTRERDDRLAKDIEVTSSEVAVQAARIIKLNKVDEALERRAEDLGRTVEILGDELQELDETCAFLGVKAEMLAESIKKIQDHTAELQKASDEHATRIGSLQQRFSRLAAELLDLGDRESRHFRAALAMLLLAALALTGFYLKQEGDTALLAERVQERAQIVNADIDSMETALATRTGELDRELGAMNTELNDRIVQLDDRVSEVNRQLLHFEDRTQSLDGRLSAESPRRNFGGDNTVHGSQWLIEQPEGGYMIQLARVGDNAQMFEITRRYGRYLQQPVSYYVEQDGSHVMLYGRFDSESEAAAALRRLPYRIGRDYPSVRTVDSVKQML